MTLSDFLTKWEEKSKNNQLAIIVHAAFECDIRTFQKWKKKTPRHTQIALAAIDKLWESFGKDVNIFFEL